MAAGDRQHVPRSGDELGAVVHADAQATAHLVLEVLDLAAVGAGKRLDVVGPAPPGLEHEPADRPAADLEDLGAAVGELANLIGLIEALVLTVALRLGE